MCQLCALLGIIPLARSHWPLWGPETQAPCEDLHPTACTLHPCTPYSALPILHPVPHSLYPVPYALYLIWPALGHCWAWQQLCW